MSSSKPCPSAYDSINDSCSEGNPISTLEYFLDVFRSSEYIPVPTCIDIENPSAQVTRGSGIPIRGDILLSKFSVIYSFIFTFISAFLNKTFIFNHVLKYIKQLLASNIM